MFRSTVLLCAHTEATSLWLDETEAFCRDLLLVSGLNHHKNKLCVSDETTTDKHDVLLAIDKGTTYVHKNHDRNKQNKAFIIFTVNKE